MSGRTIWLAKDADWHLREWLVELGEEFGPVGPLVVDWLADRADGRGGVTVGVYCIAEATAIDRDVARDIVGRALDRGVIEDLGSAWGVYRLGFTERAGYAFGRSPISKAMRTAVLARDGLVCQLCGDVVAGNDVHLDHIVPVARGGRTTIENLQVAHSRCNLRKGARV